MKIAIIGASGYVGSEILNEALSRGHQVTAMVRNPEKITVKHAKLTVVKSDVFNEVETTKTLVGHDVVVSSYNPGWQNPNIYADFLKGSETILNSAKKSGVSRLLVIGGAGSLEIAPGVQLVDTPEFPAEYKQGALAARDFLNILRKESSFAWTFLSPAILLVPGERTGSYRAGTDTPVFNANGESKITVADMAIAIVDELENPKYIKKRFTVGY
ncbi:MAG: NAD(P)-dependent oxidoreductase [Bacteroidota bacterium]|nr:NAD(P)-dependent oxidoreductase [Bacteroidota bacterium]